MTNYRDQIRSTAITNVLFVRATIFNFFFSFCELTSQTSVPLLHACASDVSITLISLLIYSAFRSTQILRTYDVTIFGDVSAVGEELGIQG